MGTIIEDLNLILDYSTKEINRGIRVLNNLEVLESEVVSSIDILNLMESLSEGVYFEEGVIYLEGLDYKYSLPYDMLPIMVARFKQNKIKYRTQAAVLRNARTK